MNKETVLEYLRTNERVSMRTQKAIMHNLGISQWLAIKHLHTLKGEGRIEIEELGTAKIYSAVFKKPGRKGLSFEQEKKIIDCYKFYHSIYKVAWLFDIHYKTVSRVLHKYSIKVTGRQRIAQVDKPKRKKRKYEKAKPRYDL